MINMLDTLKSALSLTGSVLSAFGSAFIIICYVLFRSKLQNSRHNYIFALAIADFINSANNSVSGGIVLATHTLENGAFCTANGIIGQLSIQAADYSTLLIAIVTYTALASPQKFRKFRLMWNGKAEILFMLFPWLVSSLTTVAGYFFPGYVSLEGSNWCWLAATPWYMRYVLTHGHRIMIFLIIFIFYFRLFFILRIHEKSLRAAQPQERQAQAPTQMVPGRSASLSPNAYNYKTPREIKIDIRAKGPKHLAPATSPFVSPTGTSPPSPSSTTYSGAPNLHSNSKKFKRAMLLLCLYPTVYFLLWLPTIINRAFEAANIQSHTLTFLGTVVSQYIGIFNALLYGWNENIRENMSNYLKQRSRNKVDVVQESPKSFLTDYANGNRRV